MLFLHASPSSDLILVRIDQYVSSTNCIPLLNLHFHLNYTQDFCKGLGGPKQDFTDAVLESHLGEENLGDRNGNRRGLELLSQLELKNPLS